MNPNTHIVLMGILPWGLINQGGVYVWPNQYTQAIGMVNNLTKSFARGNLFVHYIDCGHELFPTGEVCSPPLGHTPCCTLEVSEWRLCFAWTAWVLPPA